MSKWKVYEVEDKTTASGKNLKKLVLQGEGKQYPDKNVTMWGDHPLFASIAPGQEIEAEMEVKDSNVPNPKGGVYKNKTLVREKAAGSAPEHAVVNAEVKNQNTFEIIPRLDKILAKLDRLERHLIDDEGDAPPSYPPMTKENNAGVEEEELGNPF